MAKKKKHKKRARASLHPAQAPIAASRPVEVGEQVASVAATTAVLAQKTVAPTTAATTAGVADSRWSYVAGDVRRILIISAVCIGIELLLWYVLSSTPAGPAIYRLIQI